MITLDKTQSNIINNTEKTCNNRFKLSQYPSEQYYKQIAKNSYYHPLLTLRHHIKMLSDNYFSIEQSAINVDLFMLTPSVSSPMGPGSDSEPVEITFGKLKTFLVDSSQFGFEPILLNNFNKLYCYLPSMRGENPDKRHLNQFYHCECEIKGTLDDLIPIIEGYIKFLADNILLMDNIMDKISENSEMSKYYLKRLVNIDKFPVITFDEAVEILMNTGNRSLINFNNNGRDISYLGEEKLLYILDAKTPVWIKYFDRDRVPFYQKPHPDNTNKVINADLLWPPILPGAFSGENGGTGQRQDNTDEIYESLKRQNIDSKPYEWYVDLRRMPNYETTSGFGIGMERLIAWFLAKNDIKDTIPYPRLKNILSYP